MPAISSSCSQRSLAAPACRFFFHCEVNQEFTQGTSIGQVGVPGDGEEVPLHTARQVVLKREVTSVVISAEFSALALASRSAV
jgi:hypothetical protein